VLSIENAEVTVYTAPKNRYAFEKNQEWEVLAGMASHVNYQESMFIFIRKVDPNEEAVVVFDAFVEIGPPDRKAELYARWPNQNELL